MSEPSLALQTAIRARLIATPAVTALVPAASIFDRTTRPEDFPCIVIGDGQTVLEGICYSVRSVRVFADLHLWAKESGLENVKTLAGAAFDALFRELPVPGFMVNLCHATGIRFMRDPGGEHSHAVLTVEAVLGEIL